MAALMTSEAERGATTQIVKYIAECQVLGLEIRPPDIKFSDYVFTVEDKKAIRFGLAGVKNVGETAARALVAARREKGEFKTIFSVVRDVDSRIVNRKVLESLIKAGAFDSLDLPRAGAFALIDTLIEYNHDVQKSRESTQTLLFGGDGTEPPDIPAAVRTISEWEEMTRLANEKEALGLYLSGHPLSHYQRILPRLTSHTTEALESDDDIPEEIRMAGVITDLQLKKTKKDERMAVFQLDDAVGRIEVVVYTEPYKRFYGVLQDGALVWIKGRYQMDGESRKVYLSLIMPLDEAAQKLAKKFVVRIPAREMDDAFLDELYEVMDRFPGECPTLFEVEAATGHRVSIQTAELRGVTPTDELMTALEALLGPNSIRVEY
jgi:DNA polymerase-3 subunit alpha